MQDRPWEELSRLLGQLLDDSDLFTLDAAQRIFDQTADASLSKFEIQAIIESVHRRRLHVVRHEDLSPPAGLLFSANLWPSHPANLVRSVVVLETHHLGTDFDSNSIDVRCVELPRIPQHRFRSALSSDAFVYDVVSTSNENGDFSNSVVCQATTCWQTNAENHNLEEDGISNTFEPCCGWARVEGDEWSTYWRN